jgi:hypothetical protein
MTTAEADEKTPAMPDSWSGVVRDETLRDIAPANGYVTDENTWHTLWSKWHSDQSKPPEIDFDKEIILVAIARGPNRMSGVPRRNEEGDLLFTPASTLMGGPGFGYLFARTPIEGLKSINKKPFAR